MLQRVMSLFSVESVISHCREKLRRGALLCFTSVLVSKIVMDERVGGMEYHTFLYKNFCLTVAIYFLEEHFRVSLISGIENFYASQGYVTIFRGKLFVSQYRNIL